MLASKSFKMQSVSKNHMKAQETDCIASKSGCADQNCMCGQIHSMDVGKHNNGIPNKM